MDCFYCNEPMSEIEIQTWREEHGKQKNPYLRDAVTQGHHEKCGDRVWRAHLQQEYGKPMYGVAEAKKDYSRMRREKTEPWVQRVLKAKAGAYFEHTAA